MDIIAAYREAGTFRGAAEIAGTTHKTVRRVIERHEAGGAAPARGPRGHNYDGVAALVAERVGRTRGRISAKRLLPAARAAGYGGLDRNFRRLVAECKQAWRREHHRGRRPAVWSPGEHLVIDWGVLAGLHVFCAVLAWSRFRFVRFARDERAATTLALLAECFEVLGGVPGKVLADRMGCLKGSVVANVVVPTGQYVRFAGHHGFRPDFRQAADPESNGHHASAAGPRPGRRAAAAQTRRDAPASPRVADHRENPAVGTRGTAAHPGRGRDHRPGRLQCPHPHEAGHIPGDQSVGGIRPLGVHHPRRHPGLSRLPGMGSCPREPVPGRPGGTGKSHLLVALGAAAVAAGRKVRYLTAAELAETLYRGPTTASGASSTRCCATT
jgi:Integrase core domain/IstB-like ATP binding protein